MASITDDVNYCSIYVENERKRIIMQHINKDAYLDYIYCPEYIHEAQLFIQLSRNEDIHEKLFNYLLTR